MINYQRINTVPQKGIENKKAYLIGGGIASLSAAAYLIRDGHMPAKNIFILEESNVFGGSMDGAGDAEHGYVIRGGRELEEHYECTWDLYGFIPSLKNPSRTVLDEFRELNIEEPNESRCRLIEKRGQKADFSSLGLSLDDVTYLTKLLVTSDDEIGNKSVEEWFKPSFFNSNFWYFWRSMFAFENWHSVLEVKRYMVRFMHLLPGMNQLKGILHTEYNQYDSMILPLIKWLEAQGVNFEKGAQVTDLGIKINDDEKVVERIYLHHNGRAEQIDISKNDLVLVTNGSMTENSTLGSMTIPAVINRSKDNRGSWSLWENIAKKDPAFGNPSAFVDHIDKTKWLSFTVTLKDPTLFNHICKLTDNVPGMGGVVTIKDSSWLMSWTTSKQPHFMNQPEGVQVLWAYGLFPDREGDFIKKRMCDCTGEELLTELCYHMGLDKEILTILKSANSIPCMMPYITSQFMPRSKGDRPNVVPKGSKNLAFIGQFSEIPNDCVFTVEYSIRSAMMAVYTLLKLDKEVIPVYEGNYDVRVLLKAGRTMLGNPNISLDKMVGKLLFNTGLL